MKLSMWMIANRLSSLELECKIRETAAPILNSARLVYATNCVRVYQDGKDVICDGEGDLIRIRDIEVSQAFEIIQAVFDYFEDWSHQISLAIIQNDFQEAVHLAWKVFHNPFVIFDANNKVLGITDQYVAGSLDTEWNYLLQYGYSSLNAIQSMRSNDSDEVLQGDGPKVYHFPRNNQMTYGGLYYHLRFSDLDCGHMNLLAVDHEVNQGDLQLLEYIARFLEPTLGKLAMASTEASTGNVFLNLLMGTPFNRKDLDVMMAYQGWNEEDSFWLAAISLDQDRGTDKHRGISMLHALIRERLKNVVLLRHQDQLLILTNYDLSREAASRIFLEQLAGQNPIRIGISFPCKGILQADYLYRQAEAAISYGRRSTPEKSMYFFCRVAYDYILECPLFLDRVKACLPGIVHLFELRQKEQDSLLDTLIQYLNCERSISKTANALFTHRNTIQYRIAKIQEIVGYNLDDPYIRDYCRLSIRILELHEKSNKIKE